MVQLAQLMGASDDGRRFLDQAAAEASKPLLKQYKSSVGNVTGNLARSAATKRPKGKIDGVGIAVTGPLPADTLFLRASRGEFDGVVALYHDQGHIPIKLLGMHRAVNITLGLPLVRTSVAHGTGFDIVGTGRADPASMLAAIDAAARLVEADWPGATASAGASSPPAR
jgi:4-hydroxy-L-threonine phosphate dehydrogenase PdxA